MKCITSNTKPRVYNGGTYDLFHAGHVNFLRQCAKLGEVWVSLNTDEFVRKFKREPIMKYEERRAVLEACKYVHRVIPNTGGTDSKPAILRVKPEFIITGSDWATKDYYSQMSFSQEWLNEHDITLLYLPYTLGISTTEILKRCEKSGQSQ